MAYQFCLWYLETNELVLLMISEVVLSISLGNKSGWLLTDSTSTIFTTGLHMLICISASRLDNGIYHTSLEKETRAASIEYDTMPPYLNIHIFIGKNMNWVEKCQLFIKIVSYYSFPTPILNL